MKEGKRDKARFWIDVPGSSDPASQKIMIEYYALRDPAGKYLGCLEAAQNITEKQRLSGKKRLF
jgi:uncharacterized protein